MSRVWGVVGAVVGVAAAGAAAGVATQRYLRNRREPGDPLPELPEGTEHTVLADDGVRLHTEVVDPPGRPQATIVFVHGFCLDMGTWDFQRRALAATNEDGSTSVRMVFYDQAGHGRSGRRSAGEYTLDQLGEDLSAVIDATAPDGPLVLAGHSMGGMTIMALAESHPGLIADRAAGVALISTSAGDLDDIALGLPPFVARFRRPLMPLASKALRWQPNLAEFGRRAGSDVAYVLTKRYGFGGSDPDPALVRHVQEMNGGTAVEVIAGYLGTLSEHDRYAALEAFADVETLVLCGGRDRVIPPEHTAEIARLLPNATFVEIAEGGHCALMEFADEADAALLGFLERALDGRPVADRPGELGAAEKRRGKARRAGGQQRRALRRIMKRKGA